MSKHFNTSPVFQAPLFFLILCFINSAVVADPRATEAALICTNETALISQRQSFISSFLAALGTLTTLISRQIYAAAVNGTGQNTTVYAFGECLRDLSTADCDLCFAQCKTQILRCLPFQKATLGGRLFYDGCYIRYDRFSFFNESLSDEDTSVCGAARFRGNSTLFETNVGELVRRLRVEAVRKDGFFVANVSRGNVTVYGLAQCWEPVRGSGCVRCLSDAADRVRDCDGKEEGRVLNAGCYLRYSMHKFYNNDTVADGGGRNGGRSRLAMILAVTFAAFAVVFAVSAFGVLRRRKLVKKRKEKKQLGSLLSVVNKSQLNYSYEVLETSTNYFHDSNKLGQGGSGSVYKGVLPNGKVVAIKRLFFNTRQWVDHFFNEVNLISGIHHKNLVGLLGCSITGPESLLVYEYVPNQSLHDYFSVRNNLERLRWKLRSKIILGTAEGLAYLHEESKVRIIHRDIKLSNILLDEDFMPKIADFGLARLFPEDKTHISTAIAGTLGYMAPEYVTRGKLTEKADVFSFGVLLIEVISGKRINSFASNSVSILQTVWDLYGSDQLCNAVDPVLEGNFINSEASHLLRVGLLCVQASAELRPSMSSVVKMLTDQNIELPQPTQPPFLNSGSAEYRKHIPSGTSSSRPESHSHSSGNNLTQNWIEPR